MSHASAQAQAHSPSQDKMAIGEFESSGNTSRPDSQLEHDKDKTLGDAEPEAIDMAEIKRIRTKIDKRLPIMMAIMCAKLSPISEKTTPMLTLPFSTATCSRMQC